MTTKVDRHAAALTSLALIESEDHERALLTPDNYPEIFEVLAATVTLAGMLLDEFAHETKQDRGELVARIRNSIHQMYPPTKETHR